MVTWKGHAGCHLTVKWPSFIQQPYFPTLTNAELAHSVQLYTIKCWYLGTASNRKEGI